MEKAGVVESPSKSKDVYDIFLVSNPNKKERQWFSEVSIGGIIA